MPVKILYLNKTLNIKQFWVLCYGIAQRITNHIIIMLEMYLVDTAKQRDQSIT